MPTVTDKSLLAWLLEPSSHRGIRFAGRNESWDFWSYERLAHLARRVAHSLVRAGVLEHDVVALVQRSSPEFVACLFGAMLAGTVPSPMAPAGTFQDPIRYREQLTGLLRSAKPAIVVADADLTPHLGNFMARADAPKLVTVNTLLDGAAEGTRAVDRRPTELALLQFTSGSSGSCRGVRIPFDALESNVAAIRHWLRWTAADPVASWLPIHHDMGLIGCLITPIVSQSDLWLLEPEQFIHRPLRYLRCFGENGARLTSIPNFGLDHIVRRVRPETLSNMDFSHWRAVIVGGETLKPESFARFYGLLSPFGLRRTSLLPAYGLAEATLAVTSLPLTEGWTQLDLKPASVVMGRSIVRAESDDPERTSVMGCGRPVLGVSVTIANESHQSLSDGQVGEIVVRGSSVAAGYVGGASESLTHFSNGALNTGDVGFMLDGQLFVLGRLGDSIKIHGRTVFAEDIESVLTSLEIPSHRVAALLGWHKGEPTVVVILENPSVDWVREASSILRQHAAGATILLLDAPRGTITHTSSGKTKRRQLWQAFVEGLLPGILAG